MTEQEFYTQCLEWGRLPDGRFYINIDMQSQPQKGKIMRVPVTTFILTKEEEERLVASIRGLHIATNGGNLGKLGTLT